jgi:hypothetical protein
MLNISFDSYFQHVRILFFSFLFFTFLSYAGIRVLCEHNKKKNLQTNLAGQKKRNLVRTQQKNSCADTKKKHSTKNETLTQIKYLVQHTHMARAEI